MEAVKEARKSSGSDADLGLDLDLVLARTFSKWKGHDSEALAIYERLAEVRHALSPATRLPVPSSPESVCARLANRVTVKIATGVDVKSLLESSAFEQCVNGSSGC